MDQLISRQVNFIKLMLAETDYMPITHFSEQLKVSTKTLQNDLKCIGKYMNTFNLKIDIKRGKGIYIGDNTKTNIYFINSINNLNNINELSTEQRRLEILIDLLVKSEYKTSINKLSEKYYVSKTSIVNDLKYIELWLQKYNINLNRTLNGTYISGKESDIRKSIADLINDVLNNGNNKSFYEITRIELSTFAELIKIFDLDSVTFIEKQLKVLERNMGCYIIEPYYINLITHILICIKRIKEGKEIEYLDEYDNEEIDRFKNKKIYKYVKELVRCIEDKYGINLNDEEIYYIYKYIVSSRIEEIHDEDVIDDKDDRIELMVDYMVKLMSEFLNITLTNDYQLKKGLILHMKPLINRLNYDIQIKNPILKEIELEFNEILVLTSWIMKIVSMEYGLKAISIDEISYLATYFQASLDRINRNKRVMIVCHSGYGTSQFLSERIKSRFPDLEIIDILPARKLNSDLVKNIDFIISTVDLRISYIEYVFVSSLLTRADIDNIKNMIYRKTILEESEKTIVYDKNDLKEICPKHEKKYLENSIVFEMDKVKVYIEDDSLKNCIFYKNDKESNMIKIYISYKDNEYLKNILKKVYKLYHSKELFNILGKKEIN